MTSAPPSAPDLTLAVIGLAGGAATDRCRALLESEVPATALIVVRAADPQAATVPARRLAAFGRTQSALLALIEDTTHPDPGWSGAVTAAFSDPAVGAVWGPVRIAPELGARFRALGRLEYGRFDGQAPRPATPPGNCMAFRRQAVLATLPPGATGITEHLTAAALASQGWRIVHAPDARAVYAVADAHGARLSTRFGHGRLYAGTGAVRATLPGRMAGAAKALLVPGVLSLRALRRAAADPARLWLAEVPWIVLMATAWGAGELTGHLFGPGNSERTWR